MAEDATRKLLKVFGVAQTLAASAEVSRRWLEVSRSIFEEQARLHAEVLRCLPGRPRAA